MNCWLITGGAGFIGSNLARHVLETTPNRVVILDKLTYAGSLENLADLNLKENPRLTFIRGDIADRKTVEKVYQDTNETFGTDIPAPN